MLKSTKREEEIKRLILVFILGLILSGITAFPIESLLTIAHRGIHYFQLENVLTKWIEKVYDGVWETNIRYPFISYGTDWLAFAHIVIAIAFIGPYRDPIRNIWVIEFGIISCVLILPLAFIAGAVREIPFFWRILDCSFGVIGGLLLWRIHWKIKKLEATTNI